MQNDETGVGVRRKGPGETGEPTLRGYSSATIDFAPEEAEDTSVGVGDGALTVVSGGGGVLSAMGVKVLDCCGWMAAAFSPSASVSGVLSRSFGGGLGGGALKGGIGGCGHLNESGGGGLKGPWLNCGGGLVTSGSGIGIGVSISGLRAAA